MLLVFSWIIPFHTIAKFDLIDLIAAKLDCALEL